MSHFEYNYIVKFSLTIAQIKEKIVSASFLNDEQKKAFLDIIPYLSDKSLNQLVKMLNDLGQEQEDFERIKTQKLSLIQNVFELIQKTALKNTKKMILNKREGDSKGADNEVKNNLLSELKNN